MQSIAPQEEVAWVTDVTETCIVAMDYSKAQTSKSQLEDKQRDGRVEDNKSTRVFAGGFL